MGGGFGGVSQPGVDDVDDAHNDVAQFGKTIEFSFGCGQRREGSIAFDIDL